MQTQEADAAHSCGRMRWRRVTVVAVYALFAALWISMSDAVLDALMPQRELLMQLSTLKGWVFIAISSALIYWLLGKAADWPASPLRWGAGSLRRWTAPVATAGMVAASLAAVVIVDTYATQRERALGRIDALANLREAHIEQWLRDRIAQARYVSEGRRGQEYERWRAARDENQKERLLDRLREFAHATGAEAAFFIDADGTMLAELALLQDTAPPALLGALRQSRKLGGPQVAEPLPGEHPSSIYVVAALRDTQHERHSALVLKLDAHNLLTPVIGPWPVLGQASAAIVNAGDGRVIAATGKAARLPAVAMHAGEDGTLEIVDAEGQAGLAVVRAIPGTPWKLVVLADLAEADALALQKAWWIAAFAGMALVAFCIGLYLVREQQALQEAARELESLALLQGVADSSGDAIYAKDRDGRYLLLNREAARLADSDPAQVIGRELQHPCALGRAETMTAPDADVLRAGQPLTVEVDLDTVDGPRTLLATKGPLRNPAGEVIGVFGIAHDITARKRAEVELAEFRDHLQQLVAERTAQLQEANDQLGRRNAALQSAVADLEAFSYSVSHDLRAPLQAICGFAQAVNESEAHALSERGRHRLGRIVHGAKRMDEMIDDILRCSRAERAKLQVREVDLHELANDVIAQRLPQYPAARVRVHDLPTVHADSALLRQVLDNLVGNAMKFSSRADESRVEIDAQARGGSWEVRVRDNGAGFDPAYGHKLFGLFQRLHTEAEFPGTGIGLAIVKRVIARHGGTVAAESVPGGWTTFSFTLPGSQSSSPCFNA